MLEWSDDGYHIDLDILKLILVLEPEVKKEKKWEF